jgi:sensor domain CHASE-containing protein
MDTAKQVLIIIVLVLVAIALVVWIDNNYIT